MQKLTYEPKTNIETISRIFVCTVLVTILIASIAINTQIHEQTHRQTTEYCGLKSHTDLYLYGLGGGVTYPDYNNATQTQKDCVTLQAGITESIGYQITPWAIFIMLILIIQTIILTAKSNTQ